MYITWILTFSSSSYSEQNSNIKLPIVVTVYAVVWIVLQQVDFHIWDCNIMKDTVLQTHVCILLYTALVAE